MDLSTLPDEVFTTILKYNEYRTSRKLRKANTRIDRLAKRAKLTRIPVAHFEINSKSIVIHYDTYKISYDKTDAECEFPKRIFAFEEGAARFEIIRRFLTRVEVVFVIYLNEISLSDELIHLFSKANLRYVTDMLLEDVTFSLSQKSFFFFAMCPRLNDFWIRNCDGLFENVIEEEVFVNRSWKSFYIESNEIIRHQTSFLLDIARNSKMVFFDVPNCLFTVTEVGNALKKWAADSEFLQKLKLGKTSLGGIRFADVPHFLKSTAPGIRFSYETDNTLFKIKCDRWVANAYVQFTIQAPDLENI